MNKKILLTILLVIGSLGFIAPAQARYYGRSFGLGFAGGLFGAALGGALTRGYYGYSPYYSYGYSPYYSYGYSYYPYSYYY